MRPRTNVGWLSMTTGEGRGAVGSAGEAKRRQGVSVGERVGRIGVAVFSFSFIVESYKQRRPSVSRRATDGLHLDRFQFRNRLISRIAAQRRGRCNEAARKKTVTAT